MDPYKNIFSKCLILDLGSGYTKAGLSHEEQPRVVFETLVGRPNNSRTAPLQRTGSVVGSKGPNPALYRFDQPVKRGIIQNFDSVKQILGKVLEELRIKNLSETPIIITEATGAPVSQRKKLAELVFESFEGSGLYFGNQAVLGLYGLGRTTGCVLDIGHGVAQTGCIFNGYKIEHSFDRADVGGIDIDHFLAILLRKSGLYAKPQTEPALIKYIKETRCKLIDFSKQDMLQLTELGGSIEEEASIVLPDGEETRLGNERLLAPEILFKPDLIGLYSNGVQNLLARSINQVSIELRSKLHKNIYVIGGTTSLSGFAERLAQELRSVTPTNAALGISLATGRRDWHVWQGGSALSVENDLSTLWIKKGEYKEMGDSVFLRKIF